MLLLKVNFLDVILRVFSPALKIVLKFSWAKTFWILDARCCHKVIKIQNKGGNYNETKDFQNNTYKNVHLSFSNHIKIVLKMGEAKGLKIQNFGVDWLKENVLQQKLSLKAWWCICGESKGSRKQPMHLI